MPIDSLLPVNESPIFTDAEKLGTSLRKARRSSGLSQRKLADKAGIDLATVRGLEGGKGTLLPLFSVLNALGHRFSDHQEPLDFGCWIAAKRKTAGFSQEALAARVGVSKPTIIQIEHGRGNIRSLLLVFDALVISANLSPQNTVPRFIVYEGDNLDHLKTLPEGGVDSVVTDPPYGIDYMASEWDGSVPAVDLWREVFRVLKPGGFLLSFGGTRTYHRMVVAVEDAGFEIRDQISWLYGQGMPKSRNVSKDIERVHRSKREAISPATEDASKFDGYGTGLKPAQEPIVVAQKPFSTKQTIATSILLHGVGALNINACRIPGTNPSIDRRDAARRSGRHPGRPGEQGPNLTNRSSFDAYVENRGGEALGRFPANVIHDGSPEVLATFPCTKIIKNKKNAKSGFSGRVGERGSEVFTYGDDEGSTARFFFCAKPSAKERAGNDHLTVKPVALMSYLVKLVTPAGGTVLDPFAGSGTTGVAAVMEGFNAILMERDTRSVATIRRRMGKVILPR